ncbi:MAG: hypothetical protein WD965_02240 [Actinomycetota bacterium]
MRAELYRPDEHDRVIAVARWAGTGASMEVIEPAVEGLDRILRPTPVVVSDPALLPRGARGEAVLQPGSLEWFRQALLTRAPSLGLAVRFVVDDLRNGWDPAANYRSFDEQVRRLAAT